LISDWQRADFGGRKGIGADIIERCMSGPLKLHADFFFADYETLPVGRRDVVEQPDGTMRQARPGEADAALFPIDLDRARDNKRIRELEAEAKAARSERLQDRQQMQAMSAQLARLSELLEAGPPSVAAKNKQKSGTR
jgi:hypothetical protein